MSSHRYDTSICELKSYFTSVLDWTSTIFTDVEKEMCGLEWGRLYESYHNKSFNPKKVSKEVQRLCGDSYVKNRKGIFEYILGDQEDSKL
jgi:hypothetical protein